MDTLMTVSIMALLLFSRPGSARADTLLVSNQIQTRGRAPIVVRCNSVSKQYKPVLSGQKMLIDLPAAAGDDGKPEASRGVLPFTICEGKLSTIDSAFYFLFDSDEDKCTEGSCFVVAKDDGFYRWNNNKRIWDKLAPSYFF